MYRHGSIPSRLPHRPASTGEEWAASLDLAPEASVAGTDDNDSIRHELVARVRREIEAGTYETPERLQAALERLFQSIGAPV
jgi:hypothetical protein